MAPRTPSSSRISTAIARSLVACSRPWWAQKSRSEPPGRTARTAARAPHRSQRSAGETGGAAVVVVITSYPTPDQVYPFRTCPGVSVSTRCRENVGHVIALRRAVARRQRGPPSGRHPSPHPAPGPLVAPAADHRGRICRFRGLRDLGGLQSPDRGRHRPPDLLRAPLPVAALLAVLHQGLPAAGRLGAAGRTAVDLAGALHPDLPAGVPDHLLLLPEGLLPVFLAIAARLRSG